MRVTEIKGIVPGAGKTNTLVELFLKSNLPNKVLLTPTNLTRQKCIQDAIAKGYDSSKAQHDIQTLKSFTKSYIVHTKDLKTFDLENNEWVEREELQGYVSTTSKPHYKKIWNIFVDEASMFAKVEIDNLVKNWKIQNLVLDGDSLQFGPIGNSEKLEDSEGRIISEWNCPGIPYDLHVDNQVLLNKSMRARDPILEKAINEIKQGKIIPLEDDDENPEDTAIFTILDSHGLRDCENKETDWHIAYTKAKCRHLNQMYTKPKRFIVKKLDKINGFYKSEILDINDRRLSELYTRLVELSAVDIFIPSFDEWKSIHLEPAYAVNCHKLQGTTLSNGDIFVHLDDILYGLRDTMDMQTRADLFQKFLYIAVSRAVSCDQIQLYGLGKENLYRSILLESRPMQKSGKDSKGRWLYKSVEGTDDVWTEIQNLARLMKPMTDDSILADAKQFAADDPELIPHLLDNLEYDISKVSKLEGEDEYLALYSKSRSRPRPNSRKYTDEFLSNISWEELKELTRNANVRKRWREIRRLTYNLT